MSWQPRETALQYAYRNHIPKEIPMGSINTPPMPRPLTTYALSAVRPGRVAVRVTTTIDGEAYNSQIEADDQTPIGAVMRQARAVQADYLGRKLVDL